MSTTGSTNLGVSSAVTSSLRNFVTSSVNHLKSGSRLISVGYGFKNKYIKPKLGSGFGYNFIECITGSRNDLNGVVEGSTLLFNNSIVRNVEDVFMTTGSNVEYVKLDAPMPSGSISGSFFKHFKPRGFGLSPKPVFTNRKRLTKGNRGVIIRPADGRVGIGTSKPKAILHITGSVTGSSGKPNDELIHIEREDGAEFKVSDTEQVFKDKQGNVSRQKFVKGQLRFLSGSRDSTEADNNAITFDQSGDSAVITLSGSAAANTTLNLVTRGTGQEIKFSQIKPNRMQFFSTSESEATFNQSFLLQTNFPRTSEQISQGVPSGIFQINPRSVFTDNGLGFNLSGSNSHIGINKFPDENALSVSGSLSTTGTISASALILSGGSTAFTSASLAVAIKGGGGSTSPGGSDTQIQFNDGGSFGGDAGFTYDKTTDSVTIAGDITSSGTILGNRFELASGAVVLASDIANSVLHIGTSNQKILVSGPTQFGGAITASGYISASDDIMSTAYKLKSPSGGDEISVLTTSGDNIAIGDPGMDDPLLFNGDLSFMHITDGKLVFNTTIGNATSKIHFFGGDADMFVGSHITSSGNISASGIVRASEIQVNGTSVVENITTSGTQGFMAVTRGGITTNLILEDLRTTGKPQFAAITSSGDIIANGDIVGDGSTAITNLNSINDTAGTTGISFASTDQLIFTAGGVRMLELIEDDSQDRLVINSTNNDVDFIVETANHDNTLYVVGSDGEVGIGTNSPNSKLGVSGSVNVFGEGHITASNNISASGTLISNEINTIGNITASGTIFGNQIIGGSADYDTAGNIVAYGDDRNSIIIQTSNNNNDAGIAFRNSGGSYSNNIYRTNIGDSDADLRIAGGNTQGTITNLDDYVAIKGGEGTTAGFVGIGNNEPSKKLTVEGDISSSGTLTTEKIELTGTFITSSDSIKISSNADADRRAEIMIGSFSGIGNIHLNNLNEDVDTFILGNTHANNSSTPLFHAKADNETIGIGTAGASDGTKLSVGGNISVTGTNGHITASGNISASGGTITANKLVTKATATAIKTPNITIGDGNDHVRFVGTTRGISGAAASSANNQFFLTSPDSANADAIRLVLGRTTPPSNSDKILTVAGSISASSNLHLEGNLKMDATAGQDIALSDTSEIDFGRFGSATRIFSNTDGDLSIDADNDLHLRPDDDLVIEAGTTRHTTFFGEGRARIGSELETAPTSTLEVDGDISSSGNIITEGLISSSNSGTNHFVGIWMWV